MCLYIYTLHTTTCEYTGQNSKPCVRKRKTYMEIKGFLKFLVVMGMVVSGCRGDVNSFRDCYAKCFIFCMIEPNKSLCTCTTQCLKECIFPSTLATMAVIDPHAQNLGYCKLGCATSLCSNISKAHNPDGKNVESCVGSCSDKCIKSYSP